MAFFHWRAVCRTLQSGATFRRYPRRVLCPLHAQTHAALFDRGLVVERDVVHDETNTRWKILGW
jgi:hypothetical protein